MRIVEVGPRDGLQNEPNPVPVSAKVEFIARLAAAGITEIEATSFVSPKWVPQLADSGELWPLLPPGPRYDALVPNERGRDRAREVGATRLALVLAASDSFMAKNLNSSLAETLPRFEAMLQERRPGEWYRVYISTAFECPFAGRIQPSIVAALADQLLGMGADEVALGDTIGVATPREVRALATKVKDVAGKVAWHFHDTYGTGLVNVAACLNEGDWAAFDSSAGGLGGCPYAPGAAGNLATEDLVYFLEREGIATGVDLDALINATEPVLPYLTRELPSRTRRARLAPR